MLALSDTSLTPYLAAIRAFPMLTPEDEFMLARRWREHGDVEAAHTLVTSHLRLVAKIAADYRGYGLPLNELISEGTVGMMRAVKRFVPERGFRLSTYAMWWIRAEIQEYVLRSWSLVKMGTTSAQKKLFFNLRRLKRRLQAVDGGDLAPEAVKTIATELAVPEADVVSMNQRMAAPDHSLNAPVQHGQEGEWQDRLVDDADDQESRLADREESSYRRRLLADALRGLSTRERAILAERRLREQPASLVDLSERFRISRERVRQIEMRALEKLRRAIRTARLGSALGGLRQRGVERAA